MAGSFSKEKNIFVGSMVQFFEEAKWPFEAADEKDLLRMGFQGENGRWECGSYIHEHKESESARFGFTSTLSATSPTEKNPLVAEFLVRANRDLTVGSFSMDYKDGRIGLRTSAFLPASDPEIIKKLIGSAVWINVTEMDYYFPALMSVLYADVSPQEAIEKLDSDNQQD